MFSYERLQARVLQSSVIHNDSIKTIVKTNVCKYMRHNPTSFVDARHYRISKYNLHANMLACPSKKVGKCNVSPKE